MFQARGTPFCKDLEFILRIHLTTSYRAANPEIARYDRNADSIDEPQEICGVSA